MSLPRYPKYKDSGVEWLGEVPEHWQVRRLKHVCQAFPSNVDKKSHEGEQPVMLCNYTDVYYNDRITADLQFMAASASRDQIEKFTLRAGDTVITKDSETADDIAVSAYVPEGLPGVVCGYHLSIVRPRISACGSFVKRLFDSAYTKATVAVKANGLTRVGLSQYDIDNIEWPWPPIEEQEAIAAFLDRETSKIDALIAEQQRLAVLLKEKRQAVISHAVTKGLDPSVPMKASGVEWLDDVPAHWECGSLVRIANRIVVGIAEAATHAYVDSGVPILRSTNIRAGRIVGDILQVEPGFAADRGSKQMYSGDLVTVRTGNAGVTAVVPPELDQSQCFTMLITTLKKPHSSRYYCYWLNSLPAQDYFALEGWGTAQVNISVPILKALPIPIPPIVEQEHIADHLDCILDQFNALVSEAEGAMNLLRERRMGVISSAVTGQVDARTKVPDSVA